MTQTSKTCFCTGGPNCCLNIAVEFDREFDKATMPYSFDAYQREAIITAKYDGQGEFQGLAYTVLGLNGEAGEVAEQVKKTWRDDSELTDERREKIKKELGDTLWYLAMVATELGFDLSEIAKANIAKLAKRNEQGQIGGEGSNRENELPGQLDIYFYQ